MLNLYIMKKNSQINQLTKVNNQLREQETFICKVFGKNHLSFFVFFSGLV